MNDTTEKTITFDQLELIEPILRSLNEEGYTIPTPIQAQCIPHLLTGGDLIGCAQTGTGKTAAFALPLIQNLCESSRRLKRGEVRSLILSPTRELAIQIGDSCRTYARHLNLKQATIYGGVGYPNQIRSLSYGVDILVATPGRLMDLLSQNYLSLDSVEVFILDEADRMFDMGFLRDIKKILPLLPKKRQTLLFSATMPKPIEDLAITILQQPKHVTVAPKSSTADRIDEKVMFVEKSNKKALLDEVLKDSAVQRAIIFTRTKHGADRLARQLETSNFKVAAIHGNKSQNARQRALDSFRSGRIKVIVATDVFARGIDVDDITHVINYDLPNDPESYVHRIGRTARAGQSGIAISFCDAEEREYLSEIEKIIKRTVEVNDTHLYHSSSLANSYLLNKDKSYSIKKPRSRQAPPSRTRFKPRGQRRDAYESRP